MVVAHLREREREREGVRERRLARRPREGLRDARRRTGDRVRDRRLRRAMGEGDLRWRDLERDLESLRLSLTGVRDLRRGGVLDLCAPLLADKLGERGREGGGGVGPLPKMLSRNAA